MTDEWMRHPVTGLTAPHHATHTDEQAQEAPVDVQDTQKAREELWAHALNVAWTESRVQQDAYSDIRMARAAMALADEEVPAAITVARQDVAQCVAERDQARGALLRLERLAQSHAITSRARGRSETERDWLDVLAIIERAALAAEPTPSAAPHAEDGV